MNGITIENENTYRSENVIEDENINNLNENKIIEKNHDNNMTKSILLYKNGDKYFPPKRFVVNKRYIRTWDSFLEELTKTIQPRSGSIRDIRTPFHGTRIRSLDDLMINGKYVAISSGEAMKLIDYTTVVDVSSPSSQKKKEFHRLKPLKSINHETEKTETKQNSPLYTKGMVIFVYRNGDPYTRGIKIVLNQFEQKHMNNLVRAIEERVLLQTNKPIRRLYTMEGDIIRFAKDVENGHYYVAASNENFENIKYGAYLPVIRAGKVPLKPSDNKNNYTQKPKTSRIEKKEIQKELDDREVAALKIQFAFRAYLTRNAIKLAQGTNEPIPASIYKYKPVIAKPLPQNKNPKQEIKRNQNSKKDESVKLKDIHNSDEEKKVSDKIVENKTEIEDKEVVVPEVNENSDEDIQKRHFAARQIQAGFRGFGFRKQVRTFQDNGNVKNENLYPENGNIKKDEFSPENKKISVETENKVYTEKVNKIENEKSNEDKKEEDTIFANEKEREKAAIKIQCGFRAFKTRKLMKEQEELIMKEEAAKVIQSGYRGYLKRKALKNKEEEERRKRAATVIQASYRGFITRRAMIESVRLSDQEKMAEEQVKERNRAAAIIQAGFRGYSIRMRQ